MWGVVTRCVDRCHGAVCCLHVYLKLLCLHCCLWTAACMPADGRQLKLSVPRLTQVGSALLPQNAYYHQTVCLLAMWTCPVTHASCHAGANTQATRGSVIAQAIGVYAGAGTRMLAKRNRAAASSAMKRLSAWEGGHAHSRCCAPQTLHLPLQGGSSSSRLRAPCSVPVSLQVITAPAVHSSCLIPLTALQCPVSCKLRGARLQSVSLWRCQLLMLQGCLACCH